MYNYDIPQLLAQATLEEISRVQRGFAVRFPQQELMSLPWDNIVTILQMSPTRENQWVAETLSFLVATR